MSEATMTETQTVSHADAAPVSSVLAEQPKKKVEPTEYHILKLTQPSTSPSGSDQWMVVGRNVKAVSAKAAISATVTPASEGVETYVAVPSRSFKPVIVSVQTETKLVLK